MKPALKKYLFHYRWDGAEYGMTVSAYSETEARGRVSQMSLARFDGIVHATISVSFSGIISCVRAALTNTTGWH